ncbi:MAG: hypothetical protein JW724_02265 [Candidatus Altiarchaeota archaeon]|nr:hypothetical protein [Candidatus Altiarchaeota archaeon]
MFVKSNHVRLFLLASIGCIILFVPHSFPSSSEADDLDIPTERIDDAFRIGCEEFKKLYGCEPDKMELIVTNLSVAGESMNLLSVCRYKFRNLSMTQVGCKDACGICKSIVISIDAPPEGESQCVSKDACILPFVPDWKGNPRDVPKKCFGEMTSDGTGIDATPIEDDMDIQTYEEPSDSGLNVYYLIVICIFFVLLLFVIARRKPEQK